MKTIRKTPRANSYGHKVALRSRWQHGLVLLTALALIGGCGSRDVSPLAYEYAKALYSVTNRQDRDGLERIQAQLQQRQSDGSLSAAESDWLNKIVSAAASGDWEAANQAARQVMEDQVERG